MKKYTKAPLTKLEKEVLELIETKKDIFPDLKITYHKKGKKTDIDILLRNGKKRIGVEVKQRPHGYFVLEDGHLIYQPRGYYSGKTDFTFQMLQYLNRTDGFILVTNRDVRPYSPYYSKHKDKPVCICNLKDFLDVTLELLPA